MCHGSSGLSPVSGSVDPGSVSGQSMSDLWWREWHWATFFSWVPVLHFPPISVIAPKLYSPWPEIDWLQSSRPDYFRGHRRASPRRRLRWPVRSIRLRNPPWNSETATGFCITTSHFRAATVRHPVSTSRRNFVKRPLFFTTTPKTSLGKLHSKFYYLGKSAN